MLKPVDPFKPQLRASKSKGDGTWTCNPHLGGNRFTGSTAPASREERMTKRTSRVFLLTLLLWSLSASAWGVGLFLMKDADEAAPTFQLKTFEGDRIQSTELRGKIVVLDFWMSTCAPCRKEMPELEKFYQEYKDHPDVVFFMVNSGYEPLEKAKECVKKKWYQSSSHPTYRYDLPFAYDEGSEAFQRFHLTAHPSLVIIDQENRIRLKHTGMVDRILQQLSRLVDQLLAEK